MGGGQELVAEGVPLKDVVRMVEDAPKARIAEALAWALAEMRYRSASASLARSSWGDPFTPLARAHSCSNFEDLMLKRAAGGSPFLREASDGGRQLLAAGQRLGIPAAMAPAVEWCLGRWSGAGGCPFKVGRVPGDAAMARQAVGLLL